MQRTSMRLHTPVDHVSRTAKRYFARGTALAHHHGWLALQYAAHGQTSRSSYHFEREGATRYATYKTAESYGGVIDRNHWKSVDVAYRRHHSVLESPADDQHLDHAVRQWKESGYRRRPVAY